MVSPLIQRPLSLPQPSNNKSVDDLPVVQLSESSELLNSLVSLLYPIRTVVPNSYEKVLCLWLISDKTDPISQGVLSPRSV